MNYQTNSYGMNRPVYSSPLAGQQMRIRPVSSLEEVKAAAVDFDGSVFFFPDFANKRIYTKQINIDGTASLNMYELTDLPVTGPEVGSFVTRDEFNTTLVDIKNLISQLKGAAPAKPTTEARPQTKELNF